MQWRWLGKDYGVDIDTSFFKLKDGYEESSFSPGILRNSKNKGPFQLSFPMVQMIVCLGVQNSSVQRLQKSACILYNQLCESGGTGRRAGLRKLISKNQQIGIWQRLWHNPLILNNKKHFCIFCMFP